jgi:hypothetical protein
MPTYAYRWADGTVSVCSAKNRNEAMSLFDQIEPVSRKLILRIKSPVLFTVKADIDKWWVLDKSQPLGEELSKELRSECYPTYDKALSELDPDPKFGDMTKERKAKLAKALKQDRTLAEERLSKEFPTMDIVAMFPSGLPGQKN